MLSHMIDKDTDESTHSLVIALNDNYDGGGTVFYDSNQTIRLQCGQVLCFRGDSVFHGGEAVTNGTRYIIAVFLYYDESDGHYGQDGHDGHDDNLSLCHPINHGKHNVCNPIFGIRRHKTQFSICHYNDDKSITFATLAQGS
jgi:2OG-Fe(II) oxygenase superfamily